MPLKVTPLITLLTVGFDAMVTKRSRLVPEGVYVAGEVLVKEPVVDPELPVLNVPLTVTVAVDLTRATVDCTIPPVGTTLLISEVVFRYSLLFTVWAWLSTTLENKANAIRKKARILK